MGAQEKALAAFTPTQVEDANRRRQSKYEKWKRGGEKRKCFCCCYCCCFRAWRQEGKERGERTNREHNPPFGTFSKHHSADLRDCNCFGLIFGWRPEISSALGQAALRREWRGQGPVRWPARALAKLAVPSLMVVAVFKAELSQGPLSSTWVALGPKSLIYLSEAGALRGLPLLGRDVIATRPGARGLLRRVTSPFGLPPGR